MKPNKGIPGCLLVIILFNAGPLLGQTVVDSSYIKRFEKQNVVELYPGAYRAKFNFSDPGQLKNNYRLAANSSGYFGGYFNYKWLSFSYSVAMPGTQLDRYVKFQYTSFNLNFGSRKLLFQPFYDTYNGLLIPGGKRRTYEAFRGITFSDAGASITYIANAKKCSYRAANYYSEQQLRSAGSLLFTLTPMWQRVNWKTPTRELIRDSATYGLLSASPEWVSLIGRAGYTYIFSWQKGAYMVAPAVLAGFGGLKSINSKGNTIQAATDVQASLTAGYNGRTYYLYANANIDHLQSNLLIKNLRQVKSDMSLTLGYRFADVKHKVLGIL